MKTQNTEQLSYFGALMTFLSSLSWSDLASLFGIIFGLSTLLINWHYKQKDYELRKLQTKKILNDEKNN